MRGWIRRVIILLSAFLAALVLVVYVFLIAPRRLVIEEVPVVLPGWPADAAPARVALLGDLHAGADDAKWLERIVDKTLSAEPEVVILLGDYFNALAPNNAMSAEVLVAHLSPLVKRCTVYYVCGNHDRGTKGTELRRLMREAGMIPLEGRNVVHEFRNGYSLMLSGVATVSEAAFRPNRKHPSYNERRFARTKLPVACPVMLVTHSPYVLYYDELWADFAVAGHTHGGQICLPGGEPLTEESGWTRAETRSALKPGKSGVPVYVTRGLGLSRLPLRLFCAPEISLLLLEGSGKPLPNR